MSHFKISKKLKTALVMSAAFLFIIVTLGFIQDDGVYQKRRLKMVDLIESRGVNDNEVLMAMRKVPRHLFVPERYREQAYDDHALPIEEKQTISQPFIVAIMTDVIDVRPGDKVLEIGTGSGYQAAILAEIVKEVYTIEIIPELGLSAENLLNNQGYNNISFRIGDGYQGWRDFAPYDAIIVTAAPPYIPEALKEQLKIGGKMVIPVGPQGQVQSLMLLEKVSKNKIKSREMFPVRFVPMKEGN